MAARAGAHVAEELQLGGVAVVVLDELDLGRGHSARDELGAHVFIDGQPVAAGGDGKVAKDELGGAGLGGFPPDAVDLGDRLVDFAVRVVGE